MSSKDESNDLIIGVYSNKHYIKLYIELVLSPVNEETRYEYERQRDGFIDKWKNCDIVL